MKDDRIAPGIPRTHQPLGRRAPLSDNPWVIEILFTVGIVILTVIFLASASAWGATGFIDEITAGFPAMGDKTAWK